MSFQQKLLLSFLVLVALVVVVVVAAVVAAVVPLVLVVVGHSCVFFPGFQVSLSLLRSQQNCMSLLRIFHQVMQSLRRLWRSHGVSVMSREDPRRCQMCRCSEKFWCDKRGTFNAR